MGEVEPYGVMPQSEISDLKKQMKKLQEGGSLDSNQLLQSMNNLTKGMDSMLQLFKTAAEEMRIEEQEEKALTREIQPMMDKLNEIIEQNKIIAEGMVALSDIVKEKYSVKETEEEPSQQAPSQPPPVIPPLPGQPPSMYEGQPNMNIPPVPKVPPVPPGSNFPPHQIKVLIFLHHQLHQDILHLVNHLQEPPHLINHLQEGHHLVNLL